MQRFAALRRCDWTCSTTYSSFCGPARQPQWLQTPGTPLGIDTGSAYAELTTTLQPGDRVLICSDGAFEVHNAARDELGQDGFAAILKELDFPRAERRMERIEEALLKFSNAIRLQDDLTMILLEYVG